MVSYRKLTFEYDRYTRLTTPLPQRQFGNDGEKGTPVLMIVLQRRQKAHHAMMSCTSIFVLLHVSLLASAFLQPHRIWLPGNNYDVHNRHHHHHQQQQHVLFSTKKSGKNNRNSSPLKKKSPSAAAPPISSSEEGTKHKSGPGKKRAAPSKKSQTATTTTPTKKSAPVPSPIVSYEEQMGMIKEFQSVTAAPTDPSQEDPSDNILAAALSKKQRSLPIVVDTDNGRKKNSLYVLGLLDNISSALETYTRNRDTPEAKTKIINICKEIERLTLDKELYFRAVQMVTDAGLSLGDKPPRYEQPKWVTEGSTENSVLRQGMAATVKEYKQIGFGNAEILRVELQNEMRNEQERRQMENWPPNDGYGPQMGNWPLNDGYGNGAGNRNGNQPPYYEDPRDDPLINARAVKPFGASWEENGNTSVGSGSVTAKTPSTLFGSRGQRGDNAGSYAGSSLQLPPPLPPQELRQELTPNDKVSPQLRNAMGAPYNDYIPSQQPQQEPQRVPPNDKVSPQLRNAMGAPYNDYIPSQQPQQPQMSMPHAPPIPGRDGYVPSQLQEGMGAPSYNSAPTGSTTTGNDFASRVVEAGQKNDMRLKRVNKERDQALAEVERLKENDQDMAKALEELSRLEGVEKERDGLLIELSRLKGVEKLREKAVLEVSKLQDVERERNEALIEVDRLKDLASIASKKGGTTTKGSASTTDRENDKELEEANAEIKRLKNVVKALSAALT